MKITVYGLGIIGASVCASLKKAGHTVLGRNRSKAAIEYALTHGYIDGEAKSFEGADVVVLALPPRACMDVLDKESLPDGCIVTDICGVKEPIEKVVYSKKRTYRYVGIHPMAGKETSGIQSASVDLFQNKNLIMTRHAETDKQAFTTVKQLGVDMGFSRTVVCSAAEHDKMIALTSQLAHIVSNAYVKSPLTAECLGFTGGSFQDMTRIAGVDENVWTELFFLNTENITAEIKRLCIKLSEYAAALEAGDEEKMKELFVEGRQSFARFEEKK
ncbi:MAG: prephenate dehydrogenase/arogenate dehydrogenase family protein [Clostridia bacterium]|nr:prephenate dehydrogenase/arogenate dehydrogenase family protein [Clostridia bacterium]